MDETTDGNVQENGNGTLNFISTLLVSLCSNFNPYNIPEGDWECLFRSEYYYQLKSLKGKTLKFTTLERPPLSGTIVNDEGKITGVGIAFDVIHEIQRRVGFYYNITLPKENTFGNKDHGIMQLLNNQEVDMAVVFVPTLEIYRKYAAFSSALAEFEWVLMMARPSASANGSGLLAPFQATVWILILLSLIIAGPVMYLIVYLRSKFCKSAVETTKQYAMSSCVWFVYGALMKQGSILSPVSDSPRLFFATWWIFITILTSFYTANLTAFLTLSEFTLTIKTPRDIYQHDKKWMADKGGYVEAFVHNEEVFSLLRSTTSKGNNFVATTTAGKLQSILKGTIYITEKRKGQQYMLQDYLYKAKNSIPEKDRCTYVLTPKNILAKTVAFGYAKNSTLQNLLDPLLTYLVHGGIIGHLLDKSLPLTAICPLNLANSERKLKNADLMTTYKVVAIGFVFSFIAFVGEILHKFFNRGLYNKKEIVKSVQQDSNKNLLNFLHLNKKNTYENQLANDLVITQYYRDIIMPYNVPYGNKKVFSRMHERNSRQLIPNNTPTNILFQYTH